MSLAEHSWLQNIFGNHCRKRTILDLYYPWLKWKSTERQAETGVPGCGHTLWALEYIWQNRITPNHNDNYFGFRLSLAKATAQWKTETGECRVALLALEYLWQISQQSDWHRQVSRDCVNSISTGDLHMAVSFCSYSVTYILPELTDSYEADIWGWGMIGTWQKSWGF